MLFTFEEYKEYIERIVEEFDQTHDGVCDLFAVFDEDGDSKISIDEFRSGLQTTHIVCSRTTI